MRRIFFLALFTGMLGAAAYGAEAEAAANNWYGILAGDGFWGTLFVGALGLLYGWLRPVVAAYVKDSKWKRFLVILESGVGGLKALYTDKYKEANADGKLTQEEAAQINLMCRNYIINFAAREGIDVLKEYGNEALNMLIDWMLAKIKLSEAVGTFAPLSVDLSEAVSTLPALPDLQP